MRYSIIDRQALMEKLMTMADDEIARNTTTVSADEAEAYVKGIKQAMHAILENIQAVDS